MGNKINIAELLKDCPKGMELNCTMYDDVKFMKVDTESDSIILRVGNKFIRRLNKYGQDDNVDCAKCVIFPKGKTTWEGFQRPVKDGDIVVCVNYNDLAKKNVITQMFVVKSKSDYDDIGNNAYCYTGYDFEEKSLYDEDNWSFDRLATDAEKEMIFNNLQNDGYKWNAETKTLEKLIEPKFKVGDIIKNKTSRWLANRTIKSYDKNIGYFTTINDWVRIEDQDDWELVPNKFDITTLVPFESRVLVRDYDNQIWIPTFWGKRLEDDSNCRYLTTNGCYKYCIPCEGNEHLLGTTNDCDDFYKTW